MAGARLERRRPRTRAVRGQRHSTGQSGVARPLGAVGLERGDEVEGLAAASERRIERADGRRDEEPERAGLLRAIRLRSAGRTGWRVLQQRLPAGRVPGTSSTRVL
jgi:hypothetical protein